MLFLEYPSCTTCKKAKAWLQSKGLEFTARHIKEENPTAEELSLWQEKSGLELQLALLASNGMLVKRPIIVTGDAVLVGFKEKDWEKLLQK